jgi:hypothetical protein
MPTGSLLAGVLAAIVMVTGVPSAQATEATEVCRFADQRLDEISGMAVSVQHPNILWLHNDSSGGPFLYAVNLESCETVARLEITDIAARDFEGMAIGVDARDRPTIWLGDIGDNRDSWPWVWVHRIREPAELRDQRISARTFRFTYPKRPHNAETLLADPRGQDLWVVTKQLARGQLFALPAPLRPKRVNEAVFLQREGGLITDGAIAPSGRWYVLRDYVNATIYRGLPPGEMVQRIPLPYQPQGEAITWTADERALLITSEADDRLLRVPVNLEPEQAATESPTEPTVEPSVEASPESNPASQRSTLIPVVLLAAVLLGVLILTAWWGRRSVRERGEG